jgi:hypothetical protein
MPPYTHLHSEPLGRSLRINGALAQLKPQLQDLRVTSGATLAGPASKLHSKGIISAPNTD